MQAHISRTSHRHAAETEAIASGRGEDAQIQAKSFTPAPDAEGQEGGSVDPPFDQHRHQHDQYSSDQARDT